ncbi:hypothetical protein BD408DRAFT_439475 [Parasitella parasitica]|nr:hypothetical protein BD408DRAFT_439475 [Parasitella parasitica]
MSDYQQISINHQKYSYELDLDLIFNFDSHIIDYVYTDPNRTHEINDTITLEALNSFDLPELLKIESVLCFRADQDPYLLVICSDEGHSNYMFSHNVRSKTLKPVRSTKSLKGVITHADITCFPFRVAYVDRINTIDTKLSYAMVIGTTKDDATLILLTLDSSNDLMNAELTESFKTNAKDKQNIGHVTAICILAADKGDKRMGHSDPQILLGFSQGAILVYRIRASVYSYKASRIRVPVDLSEFTEFPGYPITQLSCARSYNSLLMNVALAQQKPDEIKYQYRQSYIKLVETRGDLTGRQRAIINPPQDIQSSAKILETKLIPSTTTLADSTLQLSIIFENGETSYNLAIWEVSPTRVNQLITFAMDQKSCVDAMANSDTLKNLKLDTNGYLTHVPQKIADIILEENEDEDAKHAATINSTNHSIIDDQDATGSEDAKMTELIENIDRIEQNRDIEDQNLKLEAFRSVHDRLCLNALTEINAKTNDIPVAERSDMETKNTSMMEETKDDTSTTDVGTNGDALKRECEHMDEIEAQVKRQKTLIEDYGVSDPSRTLDRNRQNNANIVMKEPHYKPEGANVENVDSDKQDNSNGRVDALDEEYVVIDHKDAITDIHDFAESPLPSPALTQNIDIDLASNCIENNGVLSIGDSYTLQDVESLSDIIVERPQEEQRDGSAEFFQQILLTNEVLEDVRYTYEAPASSVDQMNLEDTDITPFEPHQVQKQDDNDRNLGNRAELDEASYMMDEHSGPDYTDTDGQNEMFDQAAYDTFVKQSHTTVVVSSSKDGLEYSQNEEQEVSLNPNNSYRQNDEERNDDLRKETYLKESDQVQNSDVLEKDPIEDKDFLSKQDNISFVYGGKLLDVADKKIPQQIPTQQIEQQSSNTTVDYIPVSSEDLLRLLSDAQDTAADSMDIDNYATLPSYHSQATEAMEHKADAEPVDENVLAYAEMIDHCFGSNNVDLDSISQAEIDAMGNYCWNTSNIQLKMFMLKYCQLHQMRKEGFLLAKDLMQKNKKSMTSDEIEECVALKRSLKVDSSIKFGDLLNPFSAAARHKLKQQEHDFYQPQIPLDFYKSGQGQVYLDYFNTGKI